MADTPLIGQGPDPDDDSGEESPSSDETLFDESDDNSTPVQGPLKAKRVPGGFIVNGVFVSRNDIPEGFPDAPSRRPPRKMQVQGGFEEALPLEPPTLNAGDPFGFNTPDDQGFTPREDPKPRVRGLNIEAENFTPEGVADFAKLVAEAQLPGSDGRRWITSHNQGDVLQHGGDFSRPTAAPTPAPTRPRNRTHSRRYRSVNVAIPGLILAIATLIMVAVTSTGIQFPTINLSFSGFDWITLLLGVISGVIASLAVEKVKHLFTLRKRATKLVEDSLAVAKSQLESELHGASGGEVP